MTAPGPLAWHAYAQAAPLFLGGAGPDPSLHDRSAGQLTAYAQAIAAHLPARVPVVVACADRYGFAAALFAAWSRDCVVHLPSNVRPDTVAQLQRDVGASTILHDRPGCAGLDIRPLEPAGSAPPAWPAPAQIAVVVYTSGSQGKPQPHHKGAAQLLGEARALVACFQLAGHTVVSSVPGHHIYGLLFGLLAPLLAGGRIVRATPLFPDEIVRVINVTSAEVWVSVPPHLKAFADTDPTPLRRLRRVFSSGAPLPEDVALRLADSDVAVTQVFGSTETGGIAAREGRETSWRPLPGVSIDVDPAGLLLVDSPWLPEEASDAGTRPMRTADRVRRDEVGFVHEGRADSVVKVGGRRVDLADLEYRLGQIPGVRQARVIAEPGAGAHGLELLAVVETSDRGLTAAALRALLAPGLDPVSLPRRIRTIEHLPLGPAGKVARAALLALFQAEPGPGPASDWSIVTRPLGDAQWSFTAPASLGYFRGHFPAHPVLPAVVQLQRLALALARQRWNDLGPLIGLSRVKFRKLVGPGEELIVALERPRPGQVKFAMTVAGAPASSGNLNFQADQTTPSGPPPPGTP